MVIQNRFDHHFGSGLLYSCRSPSQTWPVTPIPVVLSTGPFSAPVLGATLMRPVLMRSHAQPAIDSTVRTMT